MEFLSVWREEEKKSTLMRTSLQKSHVTKKLRIKSPFNKVCLKEDIISLIDSIVLSEFIFVQLVSRFKTERKTCLSFLHPPLALKPLHIYCGVMLGGFPQWKASGDSFATPTFNSDTQ